MVPTYHVTDWPFWLGLFTLGAFAGYFVVERWIIRIISIKYAKMDLISTMRHFLPPVILTVLFLVAGICLYIGQGSVAAPQNTELAPKMEVRQDFVKSQAEEAKALTPETREMIQDARVEALDKKQVDDMNADAEHRKQIGETMNDFRTRVMNRDENAKTLTPEQMIQDEKIEVLKRKQVDDMDADFKRQKLNRDKEPAPQ